MLASLSFILLAILFPTLLTTVSLGIFILGMVVTGIPHGATDHVIFSYKEKAAGRKVSIFRFLMLYILGMAVYGLCWYYFPLVSLLIFLAISAYHFGQSQFTYIALGESHPYKTILYTSWGIWVLAAIIFLNPEESQQILAGLFASDLTAIFSLRIEILIFLSVLVLALLTLGRVLRIFTVKAYAFEIVNLLVLFMISYVGGLLISFTVYFALWHSLSSINWEIEVFKLEQPTFSWKDFVKHAWPFSLISFLGIGLLLGLGGYFASFISPFLLFFIAISVLTLPHMVYMQQFYSLKEGKFPMTEVSGA